MSHLVAYLNIAGVVMGLIGGLMTYRFGLPNIDVLTSGAYSEFETTPEILRYQRLSKIGIASISAGFLLQLPAAIYSSIG
ncbi:hypothetical protein [Burkholderia glumae]|uniref:Uncharacterized protein n=1 Tax=Burkholderia glumae TaxID=337 RepID=A0ABY5BAS8_BURGL|nr:hypothetical protein [Burkholderia glumae]USS44117.1 hypothetical protein NFI99_12560 [Burkholderia glumae]